MSEVSEKRDVEHGYRTVGVKGWRLLQWSERKDRREFNALLNRLNVRRWLKRVYGDGGAKLDGYRAGCRRRQLKRGEKRRLARRGRVITCAWCDAQWCRVPRRSGPGKTCSLRCQRALWKSKPGVAERNRQRKNELRGGGRCKRCDGAKPRGRGVRYCSRCSGARLERRAA